MSFSEIIATSSGLKPLRQLSSPIEAIRQFTPNWFAVTMGTGILALALAQFPYAVFGLHQLAEGLWLLNILLFVVFAAMYGARWLLFFDEAKQVFGHATVSMFFGTIPMGLATIINGFLGFGVARWGQAAVAGDSLFFDIAGALLVAVLAMLWLVVAWRTANGAYQGKLFVSPCIASLQRP